jgi:predicted permease
VSLLSIFAGSVLPIVTIAAVGFTLGRVRSIAVEPLNTVTIYVLTPALVFPASPRPISVARPF